MRRLSSLIKALLLICVFVVPLWALTRMDDFNRADSGTPGANWTATTGYTNPLAIFSMAASTQGSGALAASYWSADSFTGDHFSQATFVVLSDTRQAVNVRVQSGALTMYSCGFDVGQFGDHTPHIWKWFAGTPSNVTTGSGTVTAGDVIYCEAVGSTQTMKQNGSTVATGGDSGITGGAPGLEIRDLSGVQNTFFDTWSGGDVSASGGPVSGFFFGRVR